MSGAEVWMPLYPRDYLTATAELSIEQSGAYLHLLMHSWASGGPLQDDDAKLARICRVTTSRFQRAIKPDVMPFFDLGPNGWTQKRLELERHRAKEKSNLAKANAAAKWRKNKETTDADAERTHMQNGCSSPSPSPSEKKEGSLRSPSRAREAPKMPAEPMGFLEWWNGYPRKDAKHAARRAYVTALKRGATPEALLAALGAYQFDRREFPRFVPHPTTWLNQGRWESAHETLPPGGTRTAWQQASDNLSDEPPGEGRMEYLPT